MTALPPLASSSDAALFDPETAAAHRVAVFSSALVSAGEVVAPPPPWSPALPRGGELEADLAEAGFTGIRAQPIVPAEPFLAVRAVLR